MDIVDRLKFDSVRCEVQFSKGVSTNIDEAVAEIERLRRRLGPLGLVVVEIGEAGHYVNERVAAEIGRLRDDLSQALRQWRMYAESHEEVDLEHDDNAEALLYRRLLGSLQQNEDGG